MDRVCGSLGLALALSLGLTCFSLGADVPDKKDNAAKGGKNDTAAIASAFVLPKGTVLRPDQRKEFEKMKQTMEPKLRESLKKVQEATSESDKTTAAGEVKKIREDIKKQIHEILQMPSPQKDTPKPKQPQKKGGKKGGRKLR